MSRCQQGQNEQRIIEEGWREKEEKQLFLKQDQWKDPAVARKRVK